MQTCRSCGEDKPLSDFDFRKDNQKHRTQCKQCRANIEAAKRYGVTVEEVVALSEAQGQRCAICKTHADDIEHSTFKHNPLVIDHDHETGEVRGLLCPNCNAGLGQFQDDPQRLLSAIQYLTAK